MSQTKSDSDDHDLRLEASKSDNDDDVRYSLNDVNDDNDDDIRYSLNDPKGNAVSLGDHRSEQGDKFTGKSPKSVRRREPKMLVKGNLNEEVVRDIDNGLSDESSRSPTSAITPCVALTLCDRTDLERRFLF